MRKTKKSLQCGKKRFMNGCESQKPTKKDPKTLCFSFFGNLDGNYS